MSSSASTVAASRFDFPSDLYRVLAIFVRDARLAVSYELNFSIQWLGLFVQVVMLYFFSRLVPPSPNFGIGGQVGGYFDYVIVNLAFVGFQSSALQSFSRVIREGQTQGTLEVVISTPSNLSLIVLSGGAWAFTLTLLQTMAYFLIALFFGFDLHRVNLLTASVFTLLMALSLSPFGVLAAAATMTFKQAGPVQFVMDSLAYVFGGVYYPVAALPHLMQVVGWLLPITHALNGLRGAAHGASVAQLAPDAFWLCAVTLILLPISLYAFDRAVYVAKVDGTLGHY